MDSFSNGSIESNASSSVTNNNLISMNHHSNNNNHSVDHINNINCFKPSFLIEDLKSKAVKITRQFAQRHSLQNGNGVDEQPNLSLEKDISETIKKLTEIQQRLTKERNESFYEDCIYKFNDEEMEKNINKMRLSKRERERRRMLEPSDFSHLPSYLAGEKISDGRPELMQLISRQQEDHCEVISADEQNSINVMAHRLNAKLDPNSCTLDQIKHLYLKHQTIFEHIHKYQMCKYGLVTCPICEEKPNNVSGIEVMSDRQVQDYLAKQTTFFRSCLGGKKEK